MRFRTTILVSVLAAFAIGSAAMAQQDAIIWLAFSKVNSGMMDEAVALTMADKELNDGLMADGAVLDWGIATRATHLPGETNNFVQWTVLPSWEHIDPWVGAVMAKMRSMDPDEAAAMEEKAASIFAAGSHSDVVSNARSWFGSEDAQVRYIYVGEFYAHPGKEDALTEIYDSIIPAISTKLAEEGHLAGFGMHTPSLHTGDGWTHTSYYSLTSLAAVDRLHEEIGKALTPELAEKAVAVHDVARHRDSLWLVLHHGAGGGAEAAGDSAGR